MINRRQDRRGVDHSCDGRTPDRVAAPMRMSIDVGELTVVAAAVLAATVVVPARARANGAFPDTSQILIPPDRPRTLLLGTNFGLVLSEDGGGSWRWICEHGASTAGALYQLAAAPAHRLFTLGERVLGWSDDLGCTWTGLRDEAGDLLVRD